MELFEILGIILMHWFADFVMQSHKDSSNKWHSLRSLFNHTFTYSIFMWFGIVTITSKVYTIPLNSEWINSIFLFWLITLISHTITDFFTSKWTHKLWVTKREHDFFVVIGLDQILHYAQLFITYWLLFK